MLALTICLLVSTIAVFAESGISVEIPDFFANSCCTDTTALIVFSHVFIHSPKPTDVIVIGAVPFRMISAQPPADISDGSVSWEGVFSKRSQLYFKNETYTDLYYEASVPFENTIEITSGANSEGTNYDDFEFYNLKMVIYWNKQMPIAIPEPIPEYDY